MDRSTPFNSGRHQWINNFEKEIWNKPDVVMTNNRKQAETYRFNGVYGINSVEIAELKELIQKFGNKHANLDDRDDKKWTTGWLNRFQQELAKKEKAPCAAA